jgi:signal transduction histidine kinase
MRMERGLSGAKRQSAGIPIRNVFRLARLGFRRAIRRIALSQLFLIAAVVVVALAMIVLGNWIGAYLKAGIGQGVARTAASSIESLIAHNLEGLGPERPLGEVDRAKLDTVFSIGNDANSTRLLQIRIRDLRGETIYESFGGIVGAEGLTEFGVAARGGIVSRVVDLPLLGVGPLPAHSISVLEIHTPLHRQESGEVFAVADLYYSAKSILEIQARAQMDVWALVAIAGLVVIGALYVLVAYASRTIAVQRLNLARNLSASRRLSEENAALHAASERMRLDANLSNERLLARVGSDLHDGPIQLLTLIILRLSKLTQNNGLGAAFQADVQRTAQLASEAMTELRNMSSGLVLPELRDLTVAETIELAASRHEGATGGEVERSLHSLPSDAPMVVKICIYRVVQEALNNAFWHGDAGTPAVGAAVGGGTCRLTITNGAQASEGSLEENATSLGLRGMRFRVESLGGTLKMSLTPESKTIIEADIPLHGTATAWTGVSDIRQAGTP